MKSIYTTVTATTVDQAIEIARRVPAFYGVELRTDTLETPPYRGDLEQFRSAVPNELLLTRRSSNGGATDIAEVQLALDCGFDWVDVEVKHAQDTPSLEDGTLAGRALISFHDFNSARLAEVAASTLARFPRFKIAVTPQSFDEDLALMGLQQMYGSRSSIFGMGFQGLYSRYLGPFLGGRPAFVAPDDTSVAAPGQMTLHRARAVYGEVPKGAEFFFAVVGSPARHSRSPEIHNPLFRSQRVSAAYGVIETPVVEPVLAAMAADRPWAPSGVSITAPFKETAFRWALEADLSLPETVRRTSAVNTIARVGGRLVVANTDVAGFEVLTAGLTTSARILILGAGATARSAAAALESRGIPFAVVNRNQPRAERLGMAFGGGSLSLAESRRTRWDVVIDTRPSSADQNVHAELQREGSTLIRAAYGDQDVSAADARLIERGVNVIDGLALLRAQAIPQARLFLGAVDSEKDWAKVALPEVELT